LRHPADDAGQFISFSLPTLTHGNEVQLAVQLTVDLVLSRGEQTQRRNVPISEKEEARKFFAIGRYPMRGGRSPRLRVRAWA
jgi:hypothetical protein